MRRSYELDETDTGLIEQLTRWRIQEIDATTPEGRLDQMQLETERKDLTMLRNAIGAQNDKASIARNPKRLRTSRAAS